MWEFKKAVFKTSSEEIFNQFTMNYDNTCQSACDLISYGFAFSSPGRDSSGLACSQTSFPLILWASANTISMEMQMYTNPSLTTKVGSGNLWYQYGIDGIAYRINNDGKIAEFFNCTVCSFNSPIVLKYSTVQANACSALNSATYFTFDNANYATTDGLFTNNDCTGAASVGYYSNGVITRHWNGTNFATPVGC